MNDRVGWLGKRVSYLACIEPNTWRYGTVVTVMPDSCIILHDKTGLKTEHAWHHVKYVSDGKESDDGM